MEITNNGKVATIPRSGKTLRTAASGLLKSLVQTTHNVTGPQAVLLSCMAFAFAGLAGYGIHSFRDLAKSGILIDASFGDARVVVNGKAS